MKTMLAIGAGLIGSIAAAAVLIGSVSADAGQARGGMSGYGSGRSLEYKAQVLDMDADQLRTQLQDKTMLQIAQSQGLSQEEFQAKMKEQAEARWKERGLSDEQIADRRAQMEERHENCDGEGGGEHRYRHGQE